MPLIEDYLLGEFGLALLDVGVALYLMKKLKIKGIIKTDGYEIERQPYVAFQKGLDDLVALFNSGLRRINKNGLYDETLQKYGLQSKD